MPTVASFLMFEGQAQQAMDLYTRVLPHSEILDVERYGPDGPASARGRCTTCRRRWRG